MADAPHRIVQKGLFRDGRFRVAREGGAAEALNAPSPIVLQRVSRVRPTTLPCTRGTGPVWTRSRPAPRGLARDSRIDDHIRGNRVPFAAAVRGTHSPGAGPDSRTLLHLPERDDRSGCREAATAPEPSPSSNGGLGSFQPTAVSVEAEKIAAEIAGSIGIPRAGVELAVFNGDRGSATKSFAHDGFELIHGNQMLAAFLHDYDPQTRFRQSDHTVHNVLRAIDRVFDEDAAKRRAKELMAEYVVLDALIGNTDRHHENWGVLLRRKQDLGRRIGAVV